MKTLYQRILVFLDDSEESYYGMKYAIYLAKRSKAKLYGLYNMNITALDELIEASIFLPSQRMEYLEAIKKDAQNAFEDFTSLANNSRMTVQNLTIESINEENVLKLMQQHDFDLLVVGNFKHANRCVDEFLNDTEKLVHLAPCMVSIAKNRDYIAKLWKSVSKKG